jgi:hypothetical protein
VGYYASSRSRQKKKTKKETTDQKKRRQMSRQTCKAGTEKDKKWKIFLWGGKTCCALIATHKVDNANRRQKKGKS